MTISVEKLPDCKARLSVEIPSSEVDVERGRIVAAYAGQARIPGFRPGKAPRSAIEKRYRKQIGEELSERLVSQVVRKAGADENVEIIGISKVESELFGPDGGFAWAAEVVIAPEFQLASYDSIPIELPKNEVDDEQIDGVLERMRQNHAEMIEVTDRPLRAGDVAVISWVATLDGQPLEEAVEEAEEVAALAKSEEYWVKLPAEGEDDNFLPGFAGQLDGVSIGDSPDVTVTLLDEFKPEELQGKEVVFAVTVKEIKEQRLPELDDDLAAKVSDGKTLEEVREEIRKGLTAEGERMRNNLITNQILGHLGQRLEFDLPQHMVFNETQRQVNDMVNESYQRGADQGLIEEHQDEILENAATRAKMNLKTTFILEKIAEAENIQATQDEMSRQITMIAARSNRPVKKVVRELKDQDNFAGLRHDIQIAKVLEFLRAKVEITEVESGSDQSKSGFGDTDFNLSDTWLGRRRLSWILFILILTTALIVPLVGNLVPGLQTTLRSMPLPDDGQWEAGTLQSAHHFFGEDCSTCHTDAFRQVKDEACESCHARTPLHAEPE
ncbi:MAG: trigger factor, partial [Verrucomicrobiales bacterium]